MFYFGRNVEFKTKYPTARIEQVQIPDEDDPQEYEDTTLGTANETSTTTTTMQPVSTLLPTTLLAVIAEEPDLTTPPVRLLNLPSSPPRRPRTIIPPAPHVGIGAPITPRHSRSPGFRSPRSPDHLSGF